MEHDDILEMLSGGGYISGEAMSAKLGVTRAAVWKAITALRGKGYDIQAVKKRGYIWATDEDSLEAVNIRRSLTTAWAGATIAHYPAINSTNLRAKELAREGAAHGSLVVADSQSAGRGRLGRGWVSEPGMGLYMSLILRPLIEARHASSLTLLTALAVARAVEDVCGLSPGIKWPNDLTIGGRKICGILLEMAAEFDSVEWIVAGIGINLRQREGDFPPELSKIATSLQMESPRAFSRPQMLSALLSRFEEAYEAFLARGMDAIMPDYRARSVTLGAQVMTTSLSGEVYGVAEDILPDGALTLRLPDGKTMTLRGGNVSVRGVMGYV